MAAKPRIIYKALDNDEIKALTTYQRSLWDTLGKVTAVTLFFDADFFRKKAKEICAAETKTFPKSNRRKLKAACKIKYKELMQDPKYGPVINDINVIFPSLAKNLNRTTLTRRSVNSDV